MRKFPSPQASVTLIGSTTGFPKQSGRAIRVSAAIVWVEENPKLAKSHASVAAMRMIPRDFHSLRSALNWDRRFHFSTHVSISEAAPVQCSSFA
jgi:hypothetical protein